MMQTRLTRAILCGMLVLALGSARADTEGEADASGNPQQTKKTQAKPSQPKPNQAKSPPTNGISLARNGGMADPPAATGLVRIKDIADMQGVRGNQLIGYGLVVGLDGTG